MAEAVYCGRGVVDELRLFLHESLSDIFHKINYGRGVIWLKQNDSPKAEASQRELKCCRLGVYRYHLRIMFIDNFVVIANFANWLSN